MSSATTSNDAQAKTIPSSNASSSHIYNGSCLCGSITLTVTLSTDMYARPTGHLCHCSTCRKVSSSPAGVTCLMVPSTAIEVHDPNQVLKTYNDSTARSGRPIPRSFCLECGTQIGCVPTGIDARLSVIALGLFERIPEVEFECFTAQRVPWVRAVAPENKQYEYIEELVHHVPALA